MERIDSITDRTLEFITYRLGLVVSMLGSVMATAYLLIMAFESPAVLNAGLEVIVITSASLLVGLLVGYSVGPIRDVLGKSD